MSTKFPEWIWRAAAESDPTVCASKAHLPLLRRRIVTPEPYTRQTMFMKMAHRRVAVFRDVPISVRGAVNADDSDILVRALSSKRLGRLRARVQIGPCRTRSQLPIREVMRRWARGRAILGVTDLHIQQTPLDATLDTRALSDFNILRHGSDDLSSQEMMTMVIASRGNVTDSHSDDLDGSNHCFCGRKLWLAWDTFEGMRAGLQDVSRQNVPGRAKFTMSRFLSLSSARWFVVSAGDTLFLPGNLAHKVVTIEPYLGVGSFYLTLPTCLDSLTVWIRHGSLWSIDHTESDNARLVEDAARASSRILRRAREGSARVRLRWGCDAVREAHARWMRRTPSRVRKQALHNRAFADLADVAGHM